ncbi:MAG: hypothetical protein JW956_01755 [Calditrichaceae bacterium]|nr:hypothetical protein [Calditrichaceae bacterium]
MKFLELLIIFLLSLLLGCNNNSHKGHRQDMGLIEDNRLNEISGIDKSEMNKNVFWLHNDSGDSAQIFALDEKGRHLGRFKLAGIENRDWEDIAIGPGPIDGQSYIYIAEIGDNRAVYNIKYIYRFKEPVIDNSKIPYDSIIRDIAIISFNFPDGLRDAETLMIDPVRKDLIIISKREEHVGVYVLPFPQDSSSVNVPEHIAVLPMTKIVAGDISVSGNKIIVKNYENIFYWERKTGQSLRQVFLHPAAYLPYVVEPQGEAVCWSNDEQGYFTTSEEKDDTEARLYFYPLKSNLP